MQGVNQSVGPCVVLRKRDPPVSAHKGLVIRTKDRVSIDDVRKRTDVVGRQVFQQKFFSHNSATLECNEFFSSYLLPGYQMIFPLA
jgi:hypothetical protein